MALRKRSLSLLLVAALVTGCAQGGGNALPPQGVQPGRALASAGKRHRTGVQLHFKIPRRRHRRERYLSPATESIEVTAFNAGHSTQLAQAKLDTTPGSGRCTAIASGTFACTLTMAVPTGSDTFDVTAYDGPNETGNHLSATKDFPFTVVAGRPNSISLALGGIPSTIGVSLVGASPLAYGSAVGGFQFGGTGIGAVQQMRLTAADADHYTIVNPGAPVLTLTSSAPTKLSVAAAGLTGLFDVTPLKETNVLTVPNPSTAVTLTATATPVSGTGTTPVSVTMRAQNDPVVYDGTYDSSASVQAYAPWSSTPILQLPQTTSAYYITVTLDPDGNVYVCNETAGTLDVFPPGSTTASRTITGLSAPCYTNGVAVDAAGNIFVPEFSPADDVKEYAPGSSTPSRTMPNPYPVIALDASGNLYVANYNSTGISVFAPRAATTPAFSFNAGMNGAFIPAFDSSGNLYVANYGGGDVTEYSHPFSSGSTVAKTFGSGTVSAPFGVAIDGSGNVYVGNDSGATAVTEYAPDAPTTVVRTLSSGDTGPVAVDPLGNVYVGAYSVGAVQVFAPGTSTTTIQTWTTDATDAWYVAVWP